MGDFAPDDDDEHGYVGDDFGQKVDLTQRIREIMLNYPDGSSILKELLQNSDDARATDVKFCLDLRTHPTDGLAYPKLGPFQGPALLVYNSGVFAESDFKSIQNIGDSEKKKQITSTGRFGIGASQCCSSAVSTLLASPLSLARALSPYVSNNNI